MPNQYTFLPEPKGGRNASEIGKVLTEGAYTRLMNIGIMAQLVADTVYNRGGRRTNRICYIGQLAAERWPLLLVCGMVTVAVSRAVLQVLILAVAARRQPEDTMRSFSVLATWGDIGSAVGPLVAGFLFASVSAQGLYLGMAAAIAAAASVDFAHRQKH